jgi:hypothetical protein
MRKLAFVVAAVVAAIGVPSALAHNAGHIVLPDGSCLDVGSNKEAPVVAASAPGDLATGQLDLIPGAGDQYGARYAATRGKTPILPGNCPA